MIEGSWHGEAISTILMVRVTEGSNGLCSILRADMCQGCVQQPPFLVTMHSGVSVCSGFPATEGLVIATCCKILFMKLYSECHTLAQVHMRGVHKESKCAMHNVQRGA